MQVLLIAVSFYVVEVSVLVAMQFVIYTLLIASVRGIHELLIAVWIFILPTFYSSAMVCAFQELTFCQK